MGCGTSTDSGNTGNVSPQPSDYYIDRTSALSRENMQSNQTVLEVYQRLDEEICKLEEMCPGPRLTTIEAWIKYLESKQNISSNDIIQLPLHMLDDEFSEEQDEIKYSRRSRLENDVQSLVKVRQLTEKLNVMTDVAQAAKYEEFLANVSRRYIDNYTEVLKEEILEHAQKRANELRDLWTKLRTKYNELDTLIASITGNNYSNPNEMKIDEELETTRQIRDKLGGAAEQWRTASNLLRTSAKSALIATEQFVLIQSSSLAKDKIALATDCRSSLLGSLVAFKCSQEALPQVDMPHITNRQIVAVSHANEYLFTDIANADRYQHTKNVLEAYQNGLSQSIKWLHEVFQNTLKKDLQEAENDVVQLARKLRQIRSDFIRAKIGYRVYAPVQTNNVS